MESFFAVLDGASEINRSLSASSKQFDFKVKICLYIFSVVPAFPSSGFSSVRSKLNQAIFGSIFFNASQKFDCANGDGCGGEGFGKVFGRDRAHFNWQW